MNKRIVGIAFAFALAGCSDDGVAADGSADASGSSETGTASNTAATMTISDSSASMSASASETEDTSATGSTVSETASESTEPTTDSASASSESSATDSASSESTATDSASSETSATDSASSSDSAASSDSTGATDSASSSDSASATDSASSTGSASDSDSASGSSTGSASDSDSDSDTDGQLCVPVMCGNELYECGDCEDNDADDTIDSTDVECVSPCDDDESSFATGIPGDNMDPCNQDCFFDGNSGSGNDGCLWDLACDPASPGAPECPYDPDENNCPGEQPQECYENCAIPNGCDCFGCCEIFVDGVPYTVFLGDEDCSVETIELCAECTQQESCLDPCEPEECEVCIGQELPPDDCGEPTCTEGQAPCAVNADCPDGFFCQTGCCEGLE